MVRLKKFIALFDREDVPVVLLLLAVTLVSYGASRILHGSGPLVLGLLLMLYIRPLIRWVK